MSSAEGEKPIAVAPQLATGGLLRNLRIVGLCTLASRVLGLVRDMAMAALFGAGTVFDSFILAFRLPNLARQLFGEGALTTAFLPVYLRERMQGGDVAARDVLTAVALALSSFLGLILLLCEAGIMFALWRGTWSPATGLLLDLLAIMLPYMVLICTAALLSAALHALGIFLWPALVPVVLNFVWLIGMGGAALLTSDPEQQIRLVAATVTGAGLLQVLLPVVVLSRLRQGWSATWRTALPRVREVWWTMLPVVAGLTVVQMNVVLDSLLAWGLAAPAPGVPAPFEVWGLPPLLPAGTASQLYIGQRMYQFPLGVFGIALGTVLFPLLTRHAQSGEFAALRSDLTKGLRLTIAIALPASAGLVLLAEPLTTVLFRRGAYTAEDARLTAWMIAIYGSGVWAAIGISILNRAFYATGDRITPLRIGTVTLVLNLSLNIMLLLWLQGIGLAVGSVLATLMQISATIWMIDRKLGPLPRQPLFETGWRAMVASVTMVFCCLAAQAGLQQLSSQLSSKVELVVLLLVGIVSFGGTAKVLGMRELGEILKRGDDA